MLPVVNKVVIVNSESIKNLQEAQQLVEIHHFVSPDTYTIGVVVAYDSQFCMVKGIDPDGKINGLLLINRADIYNIETQSDYLWALNVRIKLAQIEGYYDIWKVDALISKIDLTQINFLWTFLQSAFQQRQVLTIGFTDDAQLDATVTGYIKQLDHEDVQVNYVDDYDLSSLWTLTCRLEQINYLRLSSFQTHEYAALMRTIFNEQVRGEY
ncbi:hypothetical protein [Periweissella fabalis]|uniref:Uncharacterized protein n=1 Tax=Periweissella fabalis TaxID=1070421 RepID=A0A7X6N267_9LACO|nr:hypothetical protein [Periweissella fabalis]MCM0598690.1 hypothetical protein [Periweissella fabalis]NKZ24343.1 hypothetical protein [Periweissella fabalis]